MTQRWSVVILFCTFAVLGVVGIALSIRTPAAFTEVFSVSHAPSTDRKRGAARSISDTKELQAATSAGPCILFVDCDWNMSVVAFRQPFSEFAAWCNQGAAYEAITIKLDAKYEDELWRAVQGIWRENAISPGGLKNYGGAGRVVWLKDGRVVDYAWCKELLDASDLRSRTITAFR